MLARIILSIILFITFLPADEAFKPDQASMDRALNGEQVTIVTKIKKFKWPEVLIYDTIDAKAEEAMAIFTDYQLQKTYIPRLIKARIVKEISSREKHVDFEMDLPFPASNSKYITGNIISQYGENYMVRWYQVKSNSAKDSFGWARFIPHGDKTVLIYKSFVVPSSIFAGLFKKKVVKEVKKTVNALKSFIIKLKQSSPDKVAELCSELRSDLSQ